MTRTGQAAIDYARGRVGTQMPDSGLCLQFVRTCFDVGSYYYSAIDAWNGSPTQHPGDRNPPAAVPLYFRTPSPYDHVVFGCSPGEVISTFNADIRSYPSIDAIERDFDGTYLGWCEDINGVRVYTPGAPGGGEDMTPEESQRLLNIESAVGRLEAASNASTPQVADVWAWERGSDPNAPMLAVLGSITSGIQSTTNATAVTVDQIAADVDSAGELSSSRSWQTVLALVISVALLAGVIVVLVAEVVSEGVYAGAGVLLGGLVAWAAATLRGRRVTASGGAA